MKTLQRALAASQFASGHAAEKRLPVADSVVILAAAAAAEAGGDEFE